MTEKIDDSQEPVDDPFQCLKWSAALAIAAIVGTILAGLYHVYHLFGYVWWSQ